jgi:small subunit ribosomal protein S6
VPRNVYETLFLLDSNHYSRDPGGVATGLNEMFESLGGTVLASRVWQEMKLAYQIGPHQKGTYWLTYVELESSKLVEFYRNCQLSEPIIRQMTLKVEPRLVEPMLAHARGELVRPSQADQVEILVDEFDDSAV